MNVYIYLIKLNDNVKAVTMTKSDAIKYAKTHLRNNEEYIIAQQKQVGQFKDILSVTNDGIVKIKDSKFVD